MQPLNTQKNKTEGSKPVLQQNACESDLQQSLSTFRSQTTWNPRHILAETDIEPDHTEQTLGNSSKRQPPFQSRKKGEEKAKALKPSSRPFFFFYFFFFTYNTSIKTRVSNLFKSYSFDQVDFNFKKLI